MSVDVFCQELRGGWDAGKAARHVADGVVNRVFVYLGPENDSSRRNIPELSSFRAQVEAAGGEVWGWWVCGKDQAVDAAAISKAHWQHRPAGWLLDIEGEPFKGRSLTALIDPLVVLGVPLVASMAGTSSSHTPYDFRTLDKHNIPIDWQCYMDSGEGPAPADGVRELYQASFVIGGWEYRLRSGDRYGWCKIGDPVPGNPRRVTVDNYLAPGARNLELEVSPREWGYTVTDRRLYKPGTTVAVGTLMGRAQYRNIRATLDVTRGAAGKHTPAAWSEIAASARVPGAARRPISVYLVENCPDTVLRAIDEGASA